MRKKSRRKRKRKNFVNEFTSQNVSLNTTARKHFRRIRDGVENGESGSVILNRLRSNGLHIGNGEFYKTVRLAKAYRQSAKTIKFAKNDTILDDSKIPLVPEHLVMRGNYQYIVKLTAGKSADVDSDGNIKTTFLTIRSTQGISKRRIKEQIALIQETQSNRGKERYEFIGDNFKMEIVEAYRRV